MPMRPSILSSALIVPALLAIAGSVCAGDGPEFKPFLYLQTRADIVSGTANSGADAVPATDNGAEQADLVDFYFRRARTGFNVSMGSISGKVTLDTDNAGRSSAPRFNGSTGSAVTVYDAWLNYRFGDGDVKHSVKIGQFQAAFNTSPFYSSANHQFAASPMTEALMANRQIGVGYMLDTAMVDVWVDVQNVRTDGNAGQSGAGADGDGLWISARAQLTGTGEWALKGWQESFAGKAGQGFAVGLELGHETEQAAGGDTVTTVGYGVDVLFHWNQITALAEYRGQNAETETAAGATSTVTGHAFRVQAGYAFPLQGGMVLEPALRYQQLDANKDVDSTASFGGSDFGVSGTEIDVGLNLYIKGHSQKVSALVTWWEAEEGNADATIVRFQHQITF